MGRNNLSKASPDELRQRWRDYIECIAEEANYMAGHRTRYGLVKSWLFRPQRRRWSNRHLQAFGWISMLWLTEGLMSVRRQLDDQYGSISLRQLLHEIEARAEIVGPSAVEVATDRETLQRGCAEALEFAQRQLAHRTPWDDAFVSMTALDRALDLIDDCAQKYHLVITGERMPVPEAEPDPAWLQSFAVAWNLPHKKRRSQRTSSSP